MMKFMKIGLEKNQNKNKNRKGVQISTLSILLQEVEE